MVHPAEATSPESERLDRFVRHCRPHVIRLVRARISAPLRRRLESEDLVQDALLVVAERGQRFQHRGEHALIRWLSRIVHFRVLAAVHHECAARRDLRREILVNHVDEANGGVDRGPGPDVAAMCQEDLQLLGECLGQLPGDERRAIVLHSIEGLSWAELSRAIGKKTAGAARMYHTRALRRLKRRVFRRIRERECQRHPQCEHKREPPEREHQPLIVD